MPTHRKQIHSQPRTYEAHNGAYAEAGARVAADWLDDMITQSSNDQRI